MINKILQSIKEIYYGLYYHYPWCCIWQYVVLSSQGKYPADEQWNRWQRTDQEIMKEANLFGYVQCDKCFNKYIEKIRMKQNTFNYILENNSPDDLMVFK